LDIWDTTFHSASLVGYSSRYLVVSCRRFLLTHRLGNGSDTRSSGEPVVVSVSKWYVRAVLHALLSMLTLTRFKPILAVQNSLLPSEIPIAMALLMFSQTFAGSLFLTFAATIFTNSLKTLIPEYAPEVDAQALITAGATGFRSLISGAELAHVLVAYAKSVDRVFYLITGAAFGCFAFAWAMGWKDIRKRKVVSAA
jgi:hypothetical protein